MSQRMKLFFELLHLVTEISVRSIEIELLEKGFVLKKERK